MGACGVKAAVRFRAWIVVWRNAPLSVSLHLSLSTYTKLIDRQRERVELKAVVGLKAWIVVWLIAA